MIERQYLRRKERRRSQEFVPRAKEEKKEEVEAKEEKRFAHIHIRTNLSPAFKWQRFYLVSVHGVHVFGGATSDQMSNVYEHLTRPSRRVVGWDEYAVRHRPHQFKHESQTPA
jgi:hypothetical protein